MNRWDKRSWLESYTSEIISGKIIPIRCKFGFPCAASSSEIRDALKDENLLKLIYNIDGSPNAANVSSLIPPYIKIKYFLYEILV